MARLPDRFSLGERDPRSVRGVPSYPMEDPVATAMGNMGRAVAGAGADLMRLGMERQQTNDRLELARATSGYNAERIKTQSEWANDQDYQTLLPRVEQRLSRSREEWAKRIRDPVIREQFLLQSQEDLERSRAWALERSRVVERDVALASFQERSVEGQRLFFEAPSDEERARLISGYAAEVDAMVEKGWVTREQGTLLKQDWQSGAALTYIQSLPADQRLAIAAGPVDVSNLDGVVDRIIGAESSGNPNARNPRSTATGAGQFIRGTWLGMIKTHRPDLAEGRSDEEILALRTNFAISREMTIRYAEENAARLRDANLPVTPGTIYLSHFAGSGGARAVLQAPDTADAATVMASAGNTTREAIVEANPFLASYTVADLKAWADRKMGNVDGAQYLRYLTPQQQMAVREGAQRDLQASYDEAQRRAVADSAALGESIERTIIDANAGRVPLPPRSVIENEPGLTEAKRNELLRSYDAADADGRLARTALGRLASDSPFFDPTSADDRNGIDALFRMDNGVDRLRAGEEGYVESAIVPLAERAGIIPRSAVSTLMQMARAGSPEQVDFALSSMDRLERTNPQVFARDFDEAAVDMVNDYRTMREFDVTPAEMVERMRRSEDPATREARRELREEGRRLAAEIDDSEITAAFDPGWFYDRPEMPPSPIMAGALRNEFRTLFADAYARTGDEDRAKTEALRKLETVWGRTLIATDGAARMMRRPPEKIYPTIDGSHEWLRLQLEEDAAPFMTEDDDFAFIVSDPTTEAEMRSSPRPSYALMIRDRNGVVRPVMDENGVPGRITFDAQAAMAAGREAFEAERAELLERRAREAATSLGELTGEAPTEGGPEPGSFQEPPLPETRIPPATRRAAEEARAQGFNRGRDALMNMGRERVAEPLGAATLPDDAGDR